MGDTRMERHPAGAADAEIPFQTHEYSVSDHCISIVSLLTEMPHKDVFGGAGCTVYCARAVILPTQWAGAGPGGLRCRLVM